MAQGPSRATLAPGLLDDFRPLWTLAPIDLVDDGWFYVDVEASGLSGILIRIVLPYITPPWTAPENYTVLQRAMVLMVLRCGAVRALASLVNAPKMPVVVPDL